MSFLPEGYKEESSSNYMKFQDGTNTFRVLSSAITGILYWKVVEGKKTPIRLRPGVSAPISELNDYDESGKLRMPKQFWAFVVYNRKENKIQILELTQVTIKQSVLSLVNNPKWGDPKNYDINVVKEGEKLKTVYTVTPDPKEEVSEEILRQYKDMNINLEALYATKGEDGKYVTGTDPFSRTEDSSSLSDEDLEKIGF